ncbi:CARDB domain-containing protein [Halorubrum sp. 48-1-W]|uniref:CARDB domain-containing protein n=1 Tax=Halorubrum sp. 48-1-W TaxID=2249761 RepID=UPI0018E5782E|nr:CARDB domain-containing protein [Halorubrum sp. 48-1-W]
MSVEDGGNAEAYWENNDLTFNTSSLQYRPNYNEYRGAPRLTYEHSAIAGEFDNGAVLLRSDPTVVRGESGTDPRISLTVLTGDISDNGVDARNVDVSPVSQGRGSVRLAPDSGDSRIVLPTAVENETALAERWNRTTDATVTVHGEDRIQVALEGNYSLSLSEVSIDGDGATEPAYLVPVTGNGTVGQSVGVEVRDTYNNPVADAEVSFDGTTGETNDDGRVFFEPDAPDDYSATINGGGESYESVPFSVTEAGSSGSTNRTFSTQWESDSATVVANGDRDLNVSVSDRSGNPIANATIDYSITPQSPDGSLSKWNQSVHDGKDNVTFEAGNAQEGESFDVFASAGDDVDTASVTVIDGSVDLQDTISENDTEFTIDHGLTNLDSGFLVVENEDTGVNEMYNISDGTSTTDVDDIGGISGGDTINATLYEDDSRRVQLDSDTTTVEDPDPNFTVDITNVNDPVTEGEDLNVDYTVENTGDETDTQTIELLDFDGQVVDSFEVTLDGGETTSGTLTWATTSGDAGTDDITVRSDDDTETQTVTIDPSMANSVSTTGSPSGSNIAGGPDGGGSRIAFDITADSEVTLTGFSVTTDIGSFTNDGSTVGGDEPPTTFSGQVTIDLARFSTNNIQNSLEEEFVDPDTGNPDIVVTLEFDDGSVLEIGIT